VRPLAVLHVAPQMTGNRLVDNSSTDYSCAGAGSGVQVSPAGIILPRQLAPRTLLGN